MYALMHSFRPLHDGKGVVLEGIGGDRRYRFRPLHDGKGVVPLSALGALKRLISLYFSSFRLSIYS